MRRLIPLLLILPAAPVLACEPPVISVDAEGMARWTDVAAHVRPALEAQAGQAPSPEHALVVLADGKSYWVPPDPDPQKIALTFGINGFVYSGPERCAPPNMPRDLDDLPPDPPPEELFGDAAPACSGGPRDGSWSAEIGPTRIEGCPALMRQMFPQSPGALPGFDASPGRLAFACPFHPDTLELSRTAGVRWQAAGPNRWVTTDLAAREFAQIPQGQGGGSHIRWEMTVVSPDEISFARNVEIVLPAEAAAMMGAAPEGCRVTGTDRWTRVGD